MFIIIKPCGKPLCWLSPTNAEETDTPILFETEASAAAWCKDGDTVTECRSDGVGAIIE